MGLGYKWTEMVGKVWSAFHGAVRTYYPGLDIDEDSPFAHPRILLDRILFYRYDGQQAENAFASFLIDKMSEHAASKLVDWGGCLFFASARARRAEIWREQIKKDMQQQFRADQVDTLRAQTNALQEAHDEVIEALKARISEAQKDAQEFDELAVQYKQEKEQYARENRNLQVQNDALRTALEAKTRKSADADIEIPDNYDDMPEWVENRLAGRLFLHPRAINGIKKAVYNNIRLVYDCLLLLAREYRNMRLGHKDAKKAWEDGLARLGLQNGRSIGKARADEQGETYYVRYPLGSNQRQFLELHLRSKSTKNNLYCLRVYFFWDEHDNLVVVGWLPSHLDTRAT
jgi:hypothetical protein